MHEQYPSDFYKVPNITFDIKKLRAARDRVLKQKKFNTLGITNFAAFQSIEFQEMQIRSKGTM